MPPNSNYYRCAPTETARSSQSRLAFRRLLVQQHEFKLRLLEMSNVINETEALLQELPTANCMKERSSHSKTSAIRSPLKSKIHATSLLHTQKRLEWINSSISRKEASPQVQKRSQPVFYKSHFTKTSKKSRLHSVWRFLQSLIFIHCERSELWILVQVVSKKSEIQETSP